MKNRTAILLMLFLLIPAVLAAATFTVTNTNDAGAGSLRQAILDANAAVGADNISFAIPGAGVQSIVLVTPLPQVLGETVIDGYTQPGSSANSLTVGNNAVILIEINGNHTAGDGVLDIRGGNSVVRGLVVNRGNTAGISLGSDNNTLEGCFIGTDPTGMIDLGNAADGVFIANYFATGNGNHIGGPTPAARNVISGNGRRGMTFDQTSNGTVENNYIGTNAAGTGALGNDDAGIVMFVTGGHRIGGPTAASRNVISGNATDGLAVQSSSNMIQNNYIGTNATGSTGIGNGGNGIHLVSGTLLPWGIVYHSDNNTIGGVGAGNVVSGNGNVGVYVHNAGFVPDGNIIRGNRLGTAADGTAALANNHGIWLGTPTNTVIGGTNAGEGNLISGNRYHGILVTGSNTVIQGNTIGANLSGTGALSNGSAGNGEYWSGILVDSPSSNTVIGGAPSTARNIISGNKGDGIALWNGATDGVTILGNYIGVGADGTTPLGNFTDPEVAWYGTGVSVRNYATNTTVGGLGAGEGNIIAYSTNYGVVSFSGSGLTIRGNAIHDNSQQGIWVGGQLGVVIAGNDIRLNAIGVALYDGATQTTVGGTTPGTGNVITQNNGAGVLLASTTGPRNAVLGNSIFSNGGLGIDLGGDGVGNSSGVNGGQIAPVLNSAQLELGTIQGSLQGAPNTTYHAEFFSNTGGDLAEGQYFLGSAPIPTDALGNGSFTVALPGLTAGTYLTATSTDPDNNSSEFSGAVGVGELTKYYGDHFVVNTTLAGVPLHWRGGSATYHISSTVPTTTSDFVGAIRQAFAEWTLAPPASYTENTLVVPDYHVFAGNIDGVNNIVYVSPDNASLWPGSATSDAWTAATGGADPNVIALTRVRYNTLNGEITDADIAINAVNPLFQYSTDGTTLGFLDMQNVITHEAGHFGGMGDIYNLGDAPYVVEMGSGNQDVAMYGIIKGSSVTGVVETKKRVIQAPDKAGISFIYGSLPPSGIDVVILIDGSTTFASSYNGFSPSLKGAQNLVLNMRDGDRVGIVKLPNTTVLGLTPVSTGRGAVLAALAGLTVGGTSGIGQGLQVASGLLTGATQSMNQRAMLLFSAGEETGAPGALTSGVLSTVQAAGAQVYTMGFAGSFGQTLGANLAQYSGGGYYLASDPTAPGGIVTSDAKMINVVDQVWTRLSGLHLTYRDSIGSGSFEYGNGFVSGQPGFVSGQPGFVTGQPGIITGQPGFVSGQPGFVSGQPGIITGQPGFVSGQPGFVSGQPGFVSGQPAIVDDGTTMIVPAATVGGATVPLGKVTATTAVGDSKVQLGLIVPGGAYPIPGVTTVPEIIDPGTGKIKISPYYLFYAWGVILPESIPFIKQRPSKFFSDISYVQGDKFAYYVIKNPKPGAWSLITAGDPQNDLAAPVTVALTVTAISDVNMSVSFDRSSYQLGDQVTVSAALKDGRGDGNQAVDEYGGGNPGGSTGGGPVTNATVQAVVTPPGGGSSETITMTHMGGGVYTGSFTNTAAAGSYDFKVTATGVLIGLTEPYTREYQQSVHVATPFSWNTVMLATNSIVIGEKADIHSGSIVVNNQRSASPNPSLPELTIGEKASTPENFKVAASRILVRDGASIGGDVFFNTITNNGTIRGDQTAPLALPVVRTLPPFETATVGTNNITVAEKKVTTISPGNYGNVVVGSKGSLVFSSGGVYNFNSLWVKEKAKLVFNGPTHVRVLVAMRADEASYVGPAQGTTFDPAGIIVYVGGAGASGDFVSSVMAGEKTSLYANFYAPNGTISLGGKTELTGALFGRDIVLGEKVDLTLATSFLGLRKEERTPWTLEPGDPAAGSALPTVFALDQNYPNPFNPTTVINYQLPAQRAVTFTVYNAIGQEVVTLVNEVQPAGNYSVMWDGKNQAGYAVSTGVYIYKLQAGSFVDIRKMMLLK